VVSVWGDCYRQVKEFAKMGQFWRSQNSQGAIQLLGNKVI
jgi:hypothetical protein